MKRLFLISIFIISIVSISAQTQTQQQKVKVRTRVTSDMKGGAPIPGAEVIVSGNRHTSGQDGMFAFAVRGKFEIKSATKPGYVMIDPKYLKGFTSYTPDAIPVIMEERNKLNRETERQTERINEQLHDENKRLKRINDSLLAVKSITEAKYDSLEQSRISDYISKMKMVYDMAESFANIDYEILKEYDRQVYTALSEGNFDEAYRLLKTRKSVEELKKDINAKRAAIDDAEKTIATAKQNLDAEIKEAADQCYRWFDYYKAKFMGDSATHYIYLRANIDTTYLEWQLDAVQEYLSIKLTNLYDYCYSKYSLMYDPKQTNKLESKKCIIRASNLVNLEQPLDFIKTYHLWGDLEKYHEHYTESIFKYKKCLKIIDSLGTDYPYLFKIWTNLGVVYIQTGNYNDGIRLLQKALYPAKEAQDHSSLFSIYNSLGDVYKERNCLDESITNYTNAVDLLINENTDFLIIKDYCKLLASLYNKKNDQKK